MFPLRKAPCTIDPHLDHPESPPILAACFLPIYFPQQHPATYQSPESVSRLLEDIFTSSTSVPHLAYFIDNWFYISNLTDRSVLSLTPHDIAMPDFHPSSCLNKFALPVAPIRHYPAWLYSPREHYAVSLLDLTCAQLSAAFAASHGPSKKSPKHILVDAVWSKFLKLRHDWIMSPSPDLLLAISSAVLTAPVSWFYHSATVIFGADISLALMLPSAPLPCADSQRLNRPSLDRLLQITTQSMPLTTRKHPKTLLRRLLLNLHPSRRPHFEGSHSSMASALVQSFTARCTELMSCDVRTIHSYTLCLAPTSTGLPATFEAALHHLLQIEYSPDVFADLTVSATVRRAGAINNFKKTLRCQNKLDTAQSSFDHLAATVQSWPTTPSDDLIMDCALDYRAATNWKLPSTCGSCSRQQSKSAVVSVAIDASAGELNLHLLRNSDPRFIEVFASLPGALSGLMLDRRAVSESSGVLLIDLCSDCHSDLRKQKIPVYALANHLYRGELPDEFQDLTWVEEMACAVYRNSAYVARIYQSSDPAQPRVFHGNTCAHEMNIVSTSSVLPLTPDHLNGMLSVVFIGPGQYKTQCLKNMFQVRKHKIWDFLVWLKHKARNPLYSDIELDPRLLDLYPEHDTLPGVTERVIHDKTTSVHDAFADETAGFEDHPALQVSNLPDASDADTTLFLERMGVSDPEQLKLHGRSFTASALRTLVLKDDERPDLIIHRGAHAINEYNNTNLFPGMFPTLYPYGIGGFEDPFRSAKISFERQANYSMDIAGRRFRSHHSFMFVALNIMQRRAAHLHASFSVKTSHFHRIAEELTSITPETLLSAANHLEKEGNALSLTPDEKKVFSLLKEVTTVSSHIPGSQGSKIKCRNEIRSYSGYFGIPTLYFTANPSAVHSPIFQVMCGDTTIDLDDCFPLVIDSTQRALRLANDPVAAADFFQFSIQTMFQHLFGWDFDKGQSSPAGGILGHVSAFYGSNELTERGQWHGHFLIWLLGAPNPSEIHAKLKSDVGYDKKLFAFFESIIHHHLPPLDIAVDPSYNPRMERPPRVPLSNTSRTPEEVKIWKSLLEHEIKKCGERLQRHECRKVCHKYGHTNDCRFQFPHELVPESRFDPDTNSIYLLCSDPTVNYFNPVILVYCRHNHDLKCILSGKAAKAAMFYITDYITKTDLKTYQMLSLLSKAVLQTVRLENANSPVAAAKALLHKCLSQLTKQQQIHAQQAAWYIRGHRDSYPSHTTVPMLSNLLMFRVRQLFISTSPDPQSTLRNAAVEDSVESDSEHDDNILENEVEPVSVRISTDARGILRKNNQFEDYLYRDSALPDITFYDFVQRFRVEVIGKQKANASHDVRLGTYRRWNLVSPHALCESHQLVEHTNLERGDGGKLLIPRVVGTTIPRINHADYHLFILAHFKPFSHSHPLLASDQNPLDVYNGFDFSESSQAVIRNWEAIHECEDERDTDRLRKREQMLKESKFVTNNAAWSSDTIELEQASTKAAREDWKVQQQLLQLKSANWFATSGRTATQEGDLLPLTPSRMKKWKEEMKSQEHDLQTLRRNALNPANPIASTGAVTETQVSPPPDNTSNNIPPTEASVAPVEAAKETRTELLDRIILEETLNAKQVIAFKIIAAAFFKYIDDEDVGANAIDCPDHKPYLRLLLSGPGGTGKTHVVKAIQRVMEAYRCKHKLRFLAPSGSAAALIDGMTLHKALSIKVNKAKGKGKGNHTPGDSEEDYSVIMSVADRTRLRDEFKDVIMILIDEVSLLSSGLLAEVDHALRFAKGNDEFFGGVMIIFSGDFYQFPPVGGSPLYSPIRSKPCQMTAAELLKRLGRIAWKTVIECVNLEEQQRMKDDPEYAEAVLRLRKRECTDEDVILFNTRAIRSFDNPDGIDMSTEGREKATAIVTTNKLRQALNLHKATANCAGTDALVICAAHDTIGKTTAPQPARSELLKTDFTKDKLSGDRALPSYLPLYLGMPVIMRSRNISTELGITNGSEGILRSFTTETCSAGYRYCTGAIIEFPNSKVCLSGLPMKHVPIEPLVWKMTFRVRMSMEHDEVTLEDITRTQGSFQPAFAVTGHAAQGRTLPSVLGWLHIGGFAAYVTASRPNGRHGLAIIQKVSREDLNHSLPPDLIFEAHRHEVMEHNTLVKHGFKEGELLELPDPEGEHLWLTNTGKPIFASTGSQKRKAESLVQESGKSSAKKLKTGATPVSPLKRSAPNSVAQLTKKPKHDNRSSPCELWPLIPQGCVWDSEDWSCAYDTVFISFYSAYKQMSDEFRRTSFALNKHTTFLSMLFDTSPVTASDFGSLRNTFRDYLFDLNPNIFHRQGHRLTSVAHITECLLDRSGVPQTVQLGVSCDRCGYCTKIVSQVHNISDSTGPTLWAEYGGTVGELETPTSQAWLDIFVLVAKKRAIAAHEVDVRHSRATHRAWCNAEPVESILFVDPPPLIQIQLHEPAETTQPLPKIYLKTATGQATYALRAIIYQGSQHFTARLFDNDRRWDYDGARLDGNIIETNTTVLENFNGRPQHIWVYCVI